MKLILFTTLFAYVFVHTTNAIDIHSLIDSDAHLDPNAQVCQLTSTQLDEVLNPAPTATITKYVLISSKLSQNFATNAAQLLSSLGFQVCAVNDSATQPLPGEVTVVHGASKVVYFGKRNAETLTRFVQKLDARTASANVVQAITNKLEKKAFQRIIVPKVVAYFPDITAPAFAVYQEAARQLTPNPPFYVVHDPKFAKKFRLTQPGQIGLLHRMEKSTVTFQSESQQVPGTLAPPATAAEIIAWISKNRGLIIHELDDTNIYDPEVLDPTKYLLAAIADQTSPLGLYFHKILTKTIQNISRENEIRANVQTLDPTQLPDPSAVQQPLPQIRLDDIEIIWIDLQKYPLAAQKLMQNDNLPPQEAYFGLVQIPAGVLTNAKPNQWFDVAQLQAPALTGLRTEADNIQLLRNWILTVTDRVPTPIAQTVDQQSATPQEPQIEVLQQAFTLEPESVSVRQGGSFVLDCQVEYKAGKCQWQKNAKLVQVGATGPYQWANELDASDCSLSVSGADATRDNGKWACQVTGANLPDGTPVVNAIVSKPVSVTVRPQQTKTSTPEKAEL